MNIYDLVDLFTESYQMIALWDLDEEREIFRGTISELPYDLDDYEVCTIDSICNPTTVITLNISKLED